jgi:hypothetical protein
LTNKRKNDNNILWGKDTHAIDLWVLIVFGWYVTTSHLKLFQHLFERSKQTTKSERVSNDWSSPQQQKTKNKSNHHSIIVSTTFKQYQSNLN